MAATHERERQLTREIAPKVEGALPGTEVLAVELTGPDRFTVFVDHVGGVDHALCERVATTFASTRSTSRRPGSSGRFATKRISGVPSAAASHCASKGATASAARSSPPENGA
jgi:hypothetical protein